MSVAEPAPPQQTVASRGQALGQLGEPVRRFMRTEAGSAGLLLAATVVALGWANLSPDGYSSFWGTDLALRLGDAELVLDLQHWVNDGLMVFFFFVVGLEVKRELAMGELTDRRRATIPLVAAVAGLAVPALVFLAFNPTGEAAVAWGWSSPPTPRSCWASSPSSGPRARCSCASSCSPWPSPTTWGR